MSLFGALFTGTSSLAAQSQNTAMISNNIANVSTTGFKRSEAFFDSLVTTESRSSRFSPGTVSVTRVQRVDQQGPIQQTSSATDSSISGNGMFPVKRSTDFGQEFLYTRSGSFSEDKQGLLRNTAGFILYAWPLDTSGNLPANQGDLSSLVPADVAFLGGLTRPTSEAQLAINLDADQTPYDTHTQSTPQTLPVDNLPAHFSRGLTVYDELGSSQTVTMEYRKIVGPMAHFTTDATSRLELTDVLADATGPTPSISAGDDFTITAGGNPAETFELLASGGTPDGSHDHEIITVQDLVDSINAYGGGGILEARLNSAGQLLIQAINPTDTIALAEPNSGTGATPLSDGSALNIIPDPTSGTYTYSPNYDIVAGTPGHPYDTHQSNFPQFSNTTNPNTQGWWELTIKHPDGSQISQGLLNFSGDGSLNASSDSQGNVDIELAGIDWFNGSSLQDFTIDIERFSQFAGNYDVIFSDQNGAELGLRTGVELTRDGLIVARFSNGASASLYKVPMITFANTNGLQEESGTAYTETDESGEENLREAGAGGAGFVEPSTLETSNVDIADEFAKLIVSQRTFSASTRVINTVDQMTEDLIRLR